MDIEALYTSGINIADELGKLRHEHVAALVSLGHAEAEVTLTQARIERDIIATAGGEKQLGSNAEARKRALTTALGIDQEYQDVVVRRNSLWSKTKGLEASIQTDRDRLGLMKAALYAHSGNGTE